MDDSHPLDLLDYIHVKGAVRPRDVEAIGIPRKYLSRLVERGQVERVGRGLYMAADAEWGPHHALAEVASRVPQGVICLLSALRFHELTSELPREVWMAVDVKAWPPHIAPLPLRLVRFSGAALTAGVEAHVVEGVPVRITSAAKTVVDCFKYRNKIGVDVAVEALRDCRRKRACAGDELRRYAAICRMTNVMRPYLEAVA
jgi:predicted transcriptional regulator of viral defense system